MQKAKILIADDDMALVQALAIRLSEEGYEIINAQDGYFAVAQAVKEHPDLMILDINMPAGDGFTVQQRTEKVRPLVFVPVIYVTGDKSGQAKNAAKQLGAFALIHKPFEFGKLLAVVKRALSGRAA